MKPQPPAPVKLFIAALYSDAGKMEEAARLLQDRYGAIDFRSQPLPFTVTDYYAPEMGSPLFRQILAFQPLIDPGELARIKLETNTLEERLAVAGQRKVNLDPGYLDYDKVVLASTKYNGQKIYLAHGIYADLTLRYSKGSFLPYPWSFPDFKTGEYTPFFLQIRTLYKQQRKVASQ